MVNLHCDYIPKDKNPKARNTSDINLLWFNRNGYNRLPPADTHQFYQRWKAYLDQGQTFGTKNGIEMKLFYLGPPYRYEHIRLQHVARQFLVLAVLWSWARKNCW